MPKFEVIHIDGLGTINRATQQFIEQDQAQCRKDNICWMCRGSLKYNEAIFHKDICRGCAEDTFGD